MAEPTRVTVARAALMEVGRGDLARLVGPNRIGDPTLPAEARSLDFSSEDRRILHRAFRLGHLADPDGAPVGCGLPPTRRGHVAACDPGDPCPVCDPNEKREKEWIR